jgi:hypothetical protein
MAAFYLDEDVPEALATLLVALGHTATTARAANRKGLPDYAQLWHAALHGWVFITLNRKDYALLHRAWRLWGVAQQHPGILIAPHVPRANLAGLATAIDALGANPAPVLANTLFAWTATAGWK